MENSNEEPSETNDATTVEDVNLNLNTNNNVQPHGYRNQTSAYNNYAVMTVDNLRTINEDPILNYLEKNPHSKNMIFDNMFGCMLDYMSHKTSHRFFVKLIERYCDEQQLESIVTKLTDTPDMFHAVVTNNFGSISVQSLIEKIQNSDGLRNKITSRMAKEITTMMCDRVSFHVVRKCFRCVSDRQKKELFEAIIENYADIVTHKEGNSALNESLIYFPEPLRNNLLEEISSQAYFLSLHSNGNYTVQKLLDTAHRRYTEKILESLKGHFVRLSMREKGKYVVKKCLLSGKEGIDMVLQELINSDKLVQIANNEFGNYVIENALVKCKESPHFDTFWKKLNQDRHLLQDKYSHNIVAELQKLEHFDSNWYSE